VANHLQQAGARGRLSSLRHLSRHPKTETLRLRLVGVGAMSSPRYHPAGLLVEGARARLMIDGGTAEAPAGRLDAWLVTDKRCELMPAIRRLARRRGLEPGIAELRIGALRIEPLPVVHTSHPAFGYLLRWRRRRIVWAPEFYRFPDWARGAHLMFAEAAGWDRPIRFARNVGGHMALVDVAKAARAARVRRLVFAHIGRPSIRALDAGLEPPFGEWGRERELFTFD
jgi:hypothetical protein